MMQVADERSANLAKEKEAREEADKKAAALEAEKEQADAKWRSEFEAKQSTIAKLQTHHSKQSITITELREEVVGLRKAVEGSKPKIAEGEAQVKQLEEQVEAEKRERLEAQESVGVGQIALQQLKVELDDSKEAHRGAQADACSLESRLKFVTSEDGRKEAIEAYRHGPVGKVELSLAVKAGFDFLKAQLPLVVPPPPGPSYPSRVQSCQPMLQGLEERGAGVKLDGSDDDDEDEDGDGEDDDGNEDP